MRRYFVKRKLTLLLYILAIICMVALLNFSTRTVTAPTKQAGQTKVNPNLKGNLIDGQDWSHFAGATLTKTGVHINPLGRAIVNQDGSGGQPNPPVNVRGPHLETTGGFKVDAKLANIPSQGSASLYFYGSVPVIYDEWRYQAPQLQIEITRSGLSAYIWNGTSDRYSHRYTWTANLDQTALVSVLLQSDKIAIFTNGTEVGSINAENIFDNGQAWFGADASLGSAGWDLEYLNAQAANGGVIKVLASSSLKNTSSDSMSLKNLSKKLPIGAAVSNYALFSDGGYRSLVGSQLSMLTPENEMKPQFIHPQPNVYSFTEADNLVDFAMANGMQVHGHTLEFSEANPRWMQNLPLNQRQRALQDHITAVVKHFGAKVNEWDVVDEPLNDNDDNNGDSSDLRQNIWFAAMGENYIDTAFKAARAANPNASLYINEYGLEADGSRWDEFLSLIKRLQARGVPVDGVGFQAHVHEQGDEIDSAVLAAHMRILANLGLKARISEMDVYGDSASHQADQYAQGLKACLVSPNCTSFTMWGLTDKYGSTTDIHNYPLSYGNDLIWDENFHAKLAYKSLQNLLINR